MMTFQEVMRRDHENVAETYGRFPLALASGKGARVLDIDGREYIDFTSGIGVNSLGFCDEGWVSAISAQAATLQHISNLYYTLPYIEVAEKLCAMSGMKRVFFSNSGAESNEGAIKAARKYSYVKYGAGRNRIVTLANSFHGRTVTTLSATGQDVFHNFFFPFTEGFTFARANDLDDTLSKLDGSVCALMLELIQGEGGVLPLEKEYVQNVAKACAERDILLIVDEVQTGIGRTGSLYCYMQYGISPDIVTSAKGLAGGLPMGAVLFNEKTASVLVKGDHATTFGGNPVACAGAGYVLSRMTEELMHSVREKGRYITERALAMKHVVSVAGMGLMLGIELDGVLAADVIKKGIENGVLLLSAKKKVRLLPPLTITREEIDLGLAALEKALNQ